MSNSDDISEAGSLLPISEDKPDLGTLQTRGLFLHDKNNNVRAMLALDDDEEPRFGLLDADGTPRISIGVGLKGDSMQGICVHDRNGAAVLQMLVDDDGRPKVELCDAAGTSRAILCLSPQGTPFISMCDGDGQARWMVSISDEGQLCVYPPPDTRTR